MCLPNVSFYVKSGSGVTVFSKRGYTGWSFCFCELVKKSDFRILIN